MSLLAILISLVVLRPVPVSPSGYAHLLKQFPDQPETLQVFLVSTGGYWVEAQYPDRRLVLHLAPAEFRHLLAGIPYARVRLTDRLAYVASQTVVALTLYPWAVPLALTPEDQSPSRGAVALGMLSPLLWAGGSALYAWHTPVTLAQGYAGLWGGFFGALHGGNVVNSVRGSFPGSVLNNLAGQYLVRRYQIPLAAVQRWANAQAYGYYHYLMLQGLFQWRFGEGSPTPYRIATAFSLLEGYADLWGSRHDTLLTTGDALFELRMAIIGGEFLPSLILSYDLARGSSSSGQLYAGASLAGHLVGLTLGRYLSRRYDLSVPGALVTFLVPFLAHSFTGGLMLLLKPNPAVYPVLFITTEVGITTLAYRMVRQVPGARWSGLRHLQPFARASTLPGQGTVLGVQFSF